MKLPQRLQGTQPDATDDPIVYLATVSNEPLAKMWVDILNDDGIRAMLKPLGPGMGAWASAATFEHEIYVLRSQLDQAQSVVRQLEANGDAADGEGADDEV